MQPPVPAAVVQPVGGSVVTATAPASGSIIEQLKRGEGGAIVLLGAALLAVSTFLPWVKVTFAGASAEITKSSNAWASNAPWLIRGFSTTDWLAADDRGVAMTNGTDMIVLAPLLLAAVALVLATRQGKRFNHDTEALVGCTALLTLLLILELVHVGGWFNDLQTLIVRSGVPVSVDGGAALGLWLAIVAAAAMTVGAVRALLAKRLA